MTIHLLEAIAATLLTGLLCAFVTLRVARRSVRWAAILAPLSVVLAVAAGLLVGMQVMLVSEVQVPLLILLATAPVALLVGVFVSVKNQRMMEQAQAELELERRRREVEEGRRELITWLSHDLRTPLAGIRAMAEALEDGVASDPRAYYGQIIESAQRTTVMVNDLMAMASLRSGTVKLQTEAVSLADLVSDLIAQIEPVAEAKTVRLEGETLVSESDMIGDGVLLTRALQNVIMNAVQYTKTDSTVTVKLDAVGSDLRVQVADECAGLQAEELEHIFTAGWRGDIARTPQKTGSKALNSGGSGLGLAIVKTIVEAHGGSVSISNNVAHTGCVVNLLLPRLGR
ncbi:sensor histidine kinase [Boudabousia marimammalium]|uniref:histidine kinase n=1 Tax=Boudabousia marimammalium TaxID=156892 RepID=A0A1Q5PT35_9ACTO|nr:HAMP domain-containing sensor histidine kinase [Boudabousia marimammalium]OKL50540.1 two-component sensor histidine kinase [Boudabousia marimammalium]